MEASANLLTGCHGHFEIGQCLFYKFSEFSDFMDFDRAARNFNGQLPFLHSDNAKQKMLWHCS
jgi:hypothetical protein